MCVYWVDLKQFMNMFSYSVILFKNLSNLGSFNVLIIWKLFFLIRIC